MAAGGIVVRGDNDRGSGLVGERAEEEDVEAGCWSNEIKGIETSEEVGEVSVMTGKPSLVRSLLKSDRSQS
jgi:hypothetical protein